MSDNSATTDGFPCVICSYVGKTSWMVRRHYESIVHRLAGDDLDNKVGFTLTIRAATRLQADMNEIPALVVLSQQVNNPDFEFDEGDDDDATSDSDPAVWPEDRKGKGKERRGDSAEFSFDEVERTSTPLPQPSKPNARLASSALTPKAPRVAPANPSRGPLPIEFSVKSWSSNGSAQGGSGSRVQAGAGVASGSAQGGSGSRGLGADDAVAVYNNFGLNGPSTSAGSAQAASGGRGRGQAEGGIQFSVKSSSPAQGIAPGAAEENARTLVPNQSTRGVEFSTHSSVASAATQSSPTLHTIRGGAFATMDSEFMMGPLPTEGNASRMRVLNRDMTRLLVEPDPSVRVELRHEDEMPQPDPRAPGRNFERILKLSERHFQVWTAVYNLLRLERVCTNCYAARKPCIGHTAYDNACPCAPYQNICRVTVPFNGEWMCFHEIKTGPTTTRTKWLYCWKCLMLFKGLHIENVKKYEDCKFGNLLPQLLFMFYINHSAMIESTSFFGPGTPRDFEEYWRSLREGDADGYPKYIRYLLLIIDFLGKNQLPLPPP